MNIEISFYLGTALATIGAVLFCCCIFSGKNITFVLGSVLTGLLGAVFLSVSLFASHNSKLSDASLAVTSSCFKYNCSVIVISDVVYSLTTKGDTLYIDPVLLNEEGINVLEKPSFQSFEKKHCLK